MLFRSWAPPGVLVSLPCSVLSVAHHLELLSARSNRILMRVFRSQEYGGSVKRRGGYVRKQTFVQKCRYKLTRSTNSRWCSFFDCFVCINFVHSPIMTFSRLLFPSISFQFSLGLCAWGERVVQKLLFVPPEYDQVDGIQSKLKILDFSMVRLERGAPPWHLAGNGPFRETAHDELNGR